VATRRERQYVCNFLHVVMQHEIPSHRDPDRIASVLTDSGALKQDFPLPRQGNGSVERPTSPDEWSACPHDRQVPSRLPVS